MRIALCTMAAPWPKRPGLSIYNAHQAAALTQAGAPTLLVAMTPYVPRWLGRAVPRLRDHAERPLEYEFLGAKTRVVRALYGHPRFVRLQVAPRAPRLTGRALSLTMGRRLDRAVAPFEPDALIFHNAALWGDLARRMSQRMGLPYAIIEHDVLPRNPRTREGRFYCDVVSEAQAIFVVGKNLLSQLRDGLGLKHTLFIPNGACLPTDEQRRTPRPEHWKGKRVILCAGAPIERKGHAVLVDAFSRANVPNSLLVFVGAPPAAVRAQIERLGIAERVEILSAMSQNEFLQRLVWADLFALPSWDEPFGLVYAEALGAETPIILTSSCGMASEIEHGEHGWIVPPKDAPALAEELRYALLDADLGAMGRAGRELVERRFTWRRNAESVVAGLRMSQEEIEASGGAIHADSVGGRPLAGRLAGARAV